MAKKYCSICGAEMDENATQCPFCNHSVTESNIEEKSLNEKEKSLDVQKTGNVWNKIKGTTWFMWVCMIFISPLGIYLLWKYHAKMNKAVKVIITVVFAFWFLILCIAGAGEDSTSTTETYTDTSVTTVSNSDDSNDTEQDVNDDVASEENSTEATTEEEVSIENLNALAKAKLYSDTMYMSKQGIYDQLVSPYGENFTAEAAQYAIDHLEADYKYNALQKAKTYQIDLKMSKSAIYDQLISEYGEQFTAEEAQYAIDNLPD